MGRAALVLGLWVAVPLWCQTELNPARLGGIRLIPTDLAVLESDEPRTDLPCSVQPAQAELAFDMRFYAGYRASIPLSALAGSGNQLRVLVRVTPLAKPENKVYLIDRFSVPALDEDAKGEASVPGEFTVGPGRYKVDWLMRDRGERVCSARWEFEAEPGEEHKDLPLSVPADTVAQRPQDLFQEAPPIQRLGAEQSLHVKLLVNFSPADPGESTLNPSHVRAIVSILRGIAREPLIGRFSLVAFNMQEQRIIYREDNVPRIDFPALGEAVEAIKLGTVDFAQLQDPDSGTRFLTRLLTEHLGPQEPEPDAVIIVGPKLFLEKKLPQDDLRQAGVAGCPVFYLNYNADPRRSPWRDAIGAVLKLYRGLEYPITFPRDLGNALTDMMFRMAPSR